MTDTSIEWTDKTWNPVRGCSRVSEGCRNCYAERIAGRFGGKGQEFEGYATGRPHDYHGQSGHGRTVGVWRWTGKVDLIPSKLAEPLHWRKPRRIFVNSMSDLFHEALPDEHIAAVFGIMACAPQHTFQILTKRPERMRRWVKSMDTMATEARFKMSVALHNAHTDYPRALQVPAVWPLPNVWLGTSIEDQATANQRLPALEATSAAKRFVSYEPALGPVDFSDGPSDPMSTMGTWSMLDHIDWLIYGGESGPHARGNDLAWARAARDACRKSGTAFFMKQVGARPRLVPFEDDEIRFRKRRHSKGGDMRDWPKDLRVREFPK